MRCSSAICLVIVATVFGSVPARAQSTGFPRPSGDIDPLAEVVLDRLDKYYQDRMKKEAAEKAAQEAAAREKQARDEQARRDAEAARRKAENEAKKKKRHAELNGKVRQDSYQKKPNLGVRGTQAVKTLGNPGNPIIAMADVQIDATFSDPGETNVLGGAMFILSGEPTRHTVW